MVYWNFLVSVPILALPADPGDYNPLINDFEFIFDFFRYCERIVIPEMKIGDRAAFQTMYMVMGIQVWIEMFRSGVTLYHIRNTDLNEFYQCAKNRIESYAREFIYQVAVN